MNYNILIKRLYVLLKLNWLKTLLRGRLLSFASFEILYNTYKKVQNLQTIIDVGANNGQFLKAASHFYPKAKIYSFEPIPELYKKLQDKYKDNLNIQVFNKALGNEEGNLTFNKNKYNHSSSFLEIEESNQNFPSNQVEKIQVEITKLDTISSTLEIQQPALLKLDVQGFELETLRGGLEIIKTQVDYIIIEANLEKLYQNQPTFTELNAFLNSLDFELETLLDFNLGKQQNYIEIDLLYKKSK